MRAGVSRINPNPFTTRPEIEGTFGVVATTHWIATAIGMATLEKGGNAFDAGVATAFALQVLQPHLNAPAAAVPPILYYVNRRQRHRGHGGGSVSRPLGDLGRALSAQRRRAAAGLDVHQPDTGRDLFACAARGAECRWRSRRADRTRPQDLVARFRRRSDRQVL